MPQWKPKHAGIEFANNRQLTAKEIELLKKWIAAGCPEGDRSQAPPAPIFPDGWSLGAPDLVVKMNEVFDIPASGPDLYRSFVLPVNLPENKWVKAFELRPTARGAIHHALFFIDDAGQSKKLRERDGLPGLRGMSFLRGMVATRSNAHPSDWHGAWEVMFQGRSRIGCPAT